MKAYPNQSTDETLNVIQITDTHLFARPGMQMHGIDTDESFANVVAAIAANESPDLVLVTGDLAQDESREAYRRLAERLAPIAALALPGNHDDTGAMADAFANTTVSMNKLHDIGAWRIVQLHTPVTNETWGRLEQNELEWFGTALATDRPTLVCLHHPPLPVGARWLDAIGLTNAEQFLEVLDRHEAVRCVIAGHVHQDTHVRRGAVDFFTTPSTSVQFRAGVTDPAIDRIAPGYRRLRLHADGSLESDVVRIAA
ncbi:MAG TPA: phosphodiesterase [Gammaproteobacteria bacterium]|nr:phosphodiesterase [Gammaproteobacteria bacterium]